MNMDIKPQPRDIKGKFKKTSLKKVAVKIGLVLIVGFYATFWINQFFDSHKLVFQSPVQTPVIILNRETTTITQLVPEALAQFIENKPRFKDPVDQYIYELFGKDGDQAVQVFRAENGTGQCDRYGVNANGTIDVGRTQINSIHFKKIPLSAAVDCYKNADFAFQIYTEQHGFGAWVAFNNGNWKKINLDNYLTK